MNRSTRHHPLAILPLATLGLMIGCAPAAKPAARPAAAKPAAGGHDHDHAEHAHPETLAAGIAELEKVVKEVGEKLAAGAKDAADDAVHAVGHLLEDLEGLLEKEPLGADLKEGGRKALAELNTCFDKLDEAMHAAAGEGESPADVHASVAERIAAAVATLKEKFVGP
jgi:hypothetical protein